MTRQYAPIGLVEDYTNFRSTEDRMGQCDLCGNGATDEDIELYKSNGYMLHQVEIVGTIRDDYSQFGHICRDCYEHSKERTFVIWMHDGNDVMTECDTLEAAMRDIADYLDNPDEYRRYAPFRITAQRDGEDVEHIATIKMGI